MSFLSLDADTEYMFRLVADKGPQTTEGPARYVLSYNVLYVVENMTLVGFTVVLGVIVPPRR
jgi:hypothetical protein